MARVVFTLSAVLVLGVTAVTDAPDATVADHRDPYAYARLLRVARAGDAASSEIEYHFTRRQGDRTAEFVITVARTPTGSVEWSAKGATLRRGKREWSCFEVGGELQCPRTSGDPGISVGSAGAFVVAAASGRYQFSDLGFRRIAGRRAHCFLLELRGASPVAGIGSRLEVCFGDLGALLLAIAIGPASTDEQIAVRVTEIDDDVLALRFARHSEGLVSLAK